VVRRGDSDAAHGPNQETIMSRHSTQFLAALAVACGFAGAAGAQAPAQSATDIAAEVDPKHGGPHRDPPGVFAASLCPPGWAPVPAGVNPALRCLPKDTLPGPRGPRPAAIPPPGCPEGWRPVSPELNPVLRCQPGSLAFARPDAKDQPRPIGCPKGWRPIGRDVNPILRCLPDGIAARPPKDAPARGCPKGWKPVGADVNPMMRCLPDRIAASRRTAPQRIGPDPGEPAQAEGARRSDPR
jgi:hypothetical protein